MEVGSTWCSLGLRHLVSYQVITISPRLGLGKSCTPLLDLWAIRPSQGTSHSLLKDLTLDLGGNVEDEIKHLIILLIYEDALRVDMYGPWGPWRTLEMTCCGCKITWRTKKPKHNLYWSKYPPNEWPSTSKIKSKRLMDHKRLKVNGQRWKE